jgi:hypothetical protein
MSETSSSLRRVLIVSPHFPPTNAPDHQRVRMSLPYYRDFGWEAEVLAVDPQFVEAPRDNALAAALPLGVAIHRCAAFSADRLRPLGIGTLGYRSWFQLDALGKALLSERRYDLVFFSTTQYLATTLGRPWRKRFGLPFVVDIQDPWRTDYYERPGSPRPPGGWKYRFARWQASRLEAKAWQAASGFMSVNEDYLAQLRERYPWFAGKPAAVIPFGASEHDFDWARAHPEIRPAFERVPGAVHLVSVGAVGPIMRRAIETLFAAVRALRAVDPEAVARLRFHFIGTSYAPDERAEFSVMPIARAHGAGDLVSEQRERIGYFEAAQTMLASDAILVPGSDDPAYRPSKLAGCALTGKPLLTLPRAGSAFERLAQEFPGCQIAALDDATAGRTIETFLMQLLNRSSSPGSSALPPEYTARATTERQCELFNQALSHG